MSAELFVNELSMGHRPESAHKHPGEVDYEICLYTIGMTDLTNRRMAREVEYPTKEAIKKLAMEHLGFDVQVEFNEHRETLTIRMPNGSKKEKRFLFLAAVYSKCSFTYA